MVGSASVQLSGTRTQLSEEEDCVAVAVCSAGDLHRHLEPRQEEGTTSRSVWKTSDSKMWIKTNLFYILLHGASICFCVKAFLLYRLMLFCLVILMSFMKSYLQPVWGFLLTVPNKEDCGTLSAGQNSWSLSAV